MKDILVGYSGFVGSNIAEQHKFSGLFNSKNIEDAFGKNPDLLVYAGVPSEMFLAEKFPEKDLSIIQNAFENIKKINPKFIVLISTITVFDKVQGIDESYTVNPEKLSSYGKNRLLLEKFIENNYENHLIIRLPAIFGKNIKKNFIYDYIHVIPALLTEKKYKELTDRDNLIKDFYTNQNNGFYKCRELNTSERQLLKKYFQKIGFSALNFTDSRSVYQFYDLSNLWKHTEIALKNNIKKLNLATEPLSVKELYNYLSGTEFNNELKKTPYNYDFRTKYSELFGGKNGYIYSKQQVKEQIKKFIEEQNEIINI